MVRAPKWGCFLTVYLKCGYKAQTFKFGRIRPNYGNGLPNFGKDVPVFFGDVRKERIDCIKELNQKDGGMLDHCQVGSNQSSGFVKGFGSHKSP